ncbi:tail protein X [Cognatishimia sp. MH4019]|uniref:tail protein X n=1 Tax=Cognatishimia sp. MH4019 TaxID=2854030 RepID=UPI001CD4AF08|nr:tail protein X [Cognatishimia sp. MH4019]
MATTYRTIEGDTVDAIAYRHYGRHNGTTEVIFEANRGLAKLPLVLPEGTILTLPDLAEADPIQTVKLYD